MQYQADMSTRVNKFVQACLNAQFTNELNRFSGILLTV